ncbi:AAA family ATPase [Hymenobacter crusticola]|uniref:ATPase n=1 Tax=Hymenobacter crusticola TaxID=1770526 RepID=A0A243WJ39_9BACT|nr:ATP-binding protein [Hymenobacter crusticola]OUJ75290.1 ATPase [Hymenobacter crusticola]
MVRVAITGPESTGKSTLSRQLAEHYGTAWAPEYARVYLDAHGPAYTLADLEEIARGQLAAEEVAVAHAQRVVFVDTDLLVIKIWAEHAFGSCPAWILQQLAQQRHDLTLLLNIDLPWEPDPLREHPHMRDYFYKVYQQELRKLGIPFAEVGGTGEQRLVQACTLVDKLLAMQREA